MIHSRASTNAYRANHMFLLKDTGGVIDESSEADDYDTEGGNDYATATRVPQTTTPSAH